MKYNIAIFILAGGRGTRLKSKINKPLYPLCNEPAIFYVLNSVKDYNFDKYIILDEKIKSTIEELFPNVKTIVQTKDGYGTSWALLSAIKQIEKYDKIIVLQSDDVLINSNFIYQLQDKLKDEYNYISYVKTQKTIGDKIKTFHDKFIKFTTKGNKSNIGRYIFNTTDLIKTLNKTVSKNGEYRLTDTIMLIQKENNNIKVIKEKQPFINMNTIEEVTKAETIISAKTNEKHLKNGVYIEFKELTKISPKVEISPGTRILGICKIDGNTKIGVNTIINNSTIHDSIISNDVNILFSFIEHAIIKQDVKIGPFANVRKNSRVEKGAVIGNFIEIKNTTIGKDSKAKHLSYLGDSNIGDNVNIGCGAITANYDGKTKHLTTIEDKAFIGCNSTLVAPLTIGESSLIAAGSTITDNVPKNALAFGRNRQLNLEGRIK